MGREGTENLQAVGGPEVPGLQGRALRPGRSFPRLCRLPLSSLPQPPSRLVVVAGGWELSGTGPGAPCPLGQQNAPPRPQHKAVSGLGCPDSRVGVAWGLACVWGT